MQVATVRNIALITLGISARPSVSTVERVSKRSPAPLGNTALVTALTLAGLFQVGVSGHALFAGSHLSLRAMVTCGAVASATRKIGGTRELGRARFVKKSSIMADIATSSHVVESARACCAERGR